MSENIKIMMHSEVLLETLLQLGFLEPNQEFNESVECTTFRIQANDSRIQRHLWTEKGMDNRFSMDKSELLQQISQGLTVTTKQT